MSSQVTQTMVKIMLQALVIVFRRDYKWDKTQTDEFLDKYNAEFMGLFEKLSEPKEKPNCYKCKHKGSVPGSAHSSCKNTNAVVRGTPHGISNGWFFHPYDFDPTWLEACTGFEAKDEN